jgi:uncharacterized membrane protein YphA (DoxX/SURF4 family)
MKYLLIILRITVGLFWIVSGSMKFWPIEPFEMLMLDQNLVPFMWVQYVARIIIVLEISLGFFILFGIQLKRVLILAGILTTIFSVHLLYQTLTYGNAADCGCMGSYVEMDNISSLIKNAFLLLITALIYMKSTNTKGKIKHFALAFLFLLGAAFAINPPNYFMDDIYVYDNGKVAPFKNEIIGKKSIENGLQIVAVVSCTCPHCETLIYNLSQLNEELNYDNISVLAWGDSLSLVEFNKKTKSTFPSKSINDSLFFAYSDGSVPKLFITDNGKLKYLLNNANISKNNLLKYGKIN